MQGPLSAEQATQVCVCSMEELYTGATGARVEKDKAKPIYDGTASHVNGWIQRNTAVRTTAPSLADAVHVIKWANNHPSRITALIRNLWPVRQATTDRKGQSKEWTML